MSISEKQVKAWLNYNCSQGNNWITQYKFQEMSTHSKAIYMEIIGGQLTQKPISNCQIGNLSHVYFTYMTDAQVITLIETIDGQLYLISNKMAISETADETDIQEPEPQPESNTIHFTDDMVNNTEESLLKKVETLPPLPQLQSIDSKIYRLSDVRDLVKCLHGKELKNIGIRSKLWPKCQLKKAQKDELDLISYMDFINVTDEATYVKLFQKYVKQSQSSTILNLTHNYSVTSSILNQVSSSKITQLIINQNFQIDDFQWLKNFPNLKLLNFWYDHRIEQSHIEQICSILPDLEVLNIHYCCRINIRVLIPILKLKNLQKLAIDDPYFWCQKSVHELFILPLEWKNLDCTSLQKIALNSKNLTMDVADYILTACPNIQQFIVDDDILKMVTKNIITGYKENEVLAFHSWQNPQKGFQINKRVSFKNMFKDNYNNKLFSESMLKKIKENREKNGEKEQIAVGEIPGNNGVPLTLQESQKIDPQ
jgi:hypothetical protein